MNPSPREPLLACPILVIDDTELHLQLIVKILRHRGFHAIITAHDGVEALEKMALCKPDLIILDLVMPRMTGSVLCKYLKAMPEYDGIPLLTLTQTPRDFVSMAELGASDCIVKPLVPSLLIAKVFEHLQYYYDQLAAAQLHHTFEMNY